MKYIPLSHSLSENRKIDGLIQQLAELDTVTKELQVDKTSIDDVCAFFDAAVDTFS